MYRIVSQREAVIRPCHSQWASQQPSSRRHSQQRLDPQNHRSYHQLVGSSAASTPLASQNAAQEIPEALETLDDASPCLMNSCEEIAEQLLQIRHELQVHQDTFGEFTLKVFDASI